MLANQSVPPHAESGNGLMRERENLARLIAQKPDLGTTEKVILRRYHHAFVGVLIATSRSAGSNRRLRANLVKGAGAFSELRAAALALREAGLR